MSDISSSANQGTSSSEINAPVCYNHPQRETYLRCSRCERPICSECAIKTPTGYRCKECVRSQQKVFETAQGIDYLVGIGIAVVLGFVGSFIASVMGFFTVFIAPIAGVIIAEAVRWAVRKRRSILLFRLAAIGAALGSLPLFLFNLASLFAINPITGGVLPAVAGLLPLLWQGLYTVLVASTVYARLGGIRIR